MKRTDLMRDIPEHLHEGCGRECRAIGREAAEGQGAYLQGRVQTSEKGPDILVGGLVIQDVIEDPLVAAIIDRGKNAEGTIIQFIGGHIARKIRQRPVKEVGVHARLRLFSPLPQPSSGWSQRAQRRGGRATSANSLGGRARRPRPRAAQPDRSRGGCTDCPVAPDPTGQPGSTYDIAYSSVANR